MIVGLIICVTISANAHEKGQFIINKYSSELSFMVMDSIHGSQSMIIEYSKFLVIVEIPITDGEGSKAHYLKEARKSL